MKRLILLFCVIMIYAAGHGQNIIQAEYFVNNDPGFGNGTAIPVSPGINEELNFNVNTQGLANGLHKLFIRAKDDNGLWSIVVNRPFMIGNFPLDPLQPVMRAEYFIDEDPGMGMGTPVLFDPNNGIAENSFFVNLHGVDAGTHMLYVRTVDSNGHWSITYAESFEVELPLIVAQFSADVTAGSLPLLLQFTDETYISEPYEWFWDFGDGNTSTLQHPQHTYSIPGKYTVSLTATSPDGTDTETKIEYITVYPPLYSLEYFFNDDPGYGNGTFVGVYSNTIGGFEFTAPLDDLAFGFNQLFFRVQDTAGHWSHTYSRSFMKAALVTDDMPDVVQVEYFVDNDPGYGLGQQLVFDPGVSAIVEAVIPLENVNPGIRRLFVRAKDQNGHWSIIFNQEFEVEPSTSCTEPVALNISNISTNSAMLEWSPGGTELEWDVLWGLNGFSPETGGTLVQNILDNNYLLEALSPSTAYDFYIRAVCDDEVSDWAGPGSFTTLEEQIIELPTLQTAEVVQVTKTSATSGGNVTSDGGAPVTAHGLVWSTTENPTVEFNEGITYDGQGTGSWVSELAELTPATAYFVRAYATNSEGNGYGDQLTFTTLVDLTIPIVTTAPVTDITQNSANSGGEVTFDGNTSVIARGVVWSTSENPTVQNHEGITYDGEGTGSFISQIAGLAPATTYFVRAYATNSEGTGYGEVLGFTTFSETIPGINLIRGGPPETEPLAIPIQITGENANPWNIDLNNWTGSWGAPQAIFDQGEYMNDTDFWSNIQGNTNSGSTWYNSLPGVGYGILVVDMQQLRTISNISVFQMFSDGITTHIALAGHPESGDTAPDAFDTGWVDFLPKSTVNEGTDYLLYVGDPSKFVVNATTRYIKIMAYNDGSLGSSGYIELKGIKVYGSAATPELPELITAEVTEITTISAVSGGNVLSDGDTFVASRGIVWSTLEYPTVDANEGITSDGAGLGVFTSNLSGLTHNTSYYVRAYATNDAGTSYGEQQMFTTLSLHQINLPEGWIGLSGYLVPSKPAMEDVFASIADELIIAQTMAQIYYPGENINQIGNWESQSAYKVKTNAACVLNIEGELETNLAVQLNAGWNLLPVVTPDGADPADLFMPVNGFVIAKDIAGTGVYWPQYNINSIGNIVPGKAYFVLMTTPGVVDYTGMKSNRNLTGLDKTLTGFQTLSGLGYNITPTPSTHSIAILPEALKDFEQGTIIGAFDHNGNCFGATIISEGGNSLTVFGDDPMSAKKDGFFEGEMILFKTLSGLTPTFDQNLPQSNGLFTENGLSAITGFEGATGVGGGVVFSQLHIYPNPSDGIVYLSGLDEKATITVTDMLGNVINHAKSSSAGLITITLTGSNSGIYFIKIEQSGQTTFRKLVLR